LPSDLRLERALPRVEAALSGCQAVIAHNFPSCALLGHSELPGVTRAWYCNEPHRRLHLLESNPTMYARSQVVKPSTIAERAFDRKLRLYRYEMRLPSGKRRRRAFDLEHTPKVEVICANSEFTRDNLRRIYGRADAHVVYPIVRFPAHGRSRTGIDRTRGLQILTQSRLDSVKNIDHVLRGFALYQRRAAGALLHVVGVGPEARALRRLADELGLGSSIRFHGFLPIQELERIYDACDVFALTPIDEPFGMVFPEAAARGLLLVGPNHAGPNEILDAGRLGWTCDPFEPESLAQAFEQIEASSDAELDARRVQLDQACRARFGEATIGPLIERLVLGPAAANRGGVRVD
jgi:glycosyltransferase involved in cell wall biosynthesis